MLRVRFFFNVLEHHVMAESFSRLKVTDFSPSSFDIKKHSDQEDENCTFTAFQNEHNRASFIKHKQKCLPFKDFTEKKKKNH